MYVCAWVYIDAQYRNSEEGLGSSGTWLLDGGRPPCVLEIEFLSSKE